MEWLFAHADILVYVSGGFLTFLIWNVNQARDIKEMKAQGKVRDAEIAALRAKQETLSVELVAELRKLGEKLAHIEGYLHHASSGLSVKKK